MNILFFLVVFSIFIMLYLLFKKCNNSLLISFFCSLLIFKIIIDPKSSIEAALLGSKLFFTSVFPSLFPFLFLANIIIYYDGIYIYSKLFGNFLCKPLRLPKECSFSIIISMLCGYPLGAKYACELYEKKNIDFDTCTRLISIATNASPLFVIGAIGTGMLKNPIAGYILIFSNYVSCLFMSFIIAPQKTPITTVKTQTWNRKNSTPKDLGSALKICIDNSIATSLSIGGFIIAFSVITYLIQKDFLFSFCTSKALILFGVSKNLMEGLLLGTVEMTNGCYLIATSSVGLPYAMVFISFLLGFSGLSIIFQAYTFMHKHNFSIKTYIFRKFLQGILGSFITFILYILISSKMSLQVFSSLNNKENSFSILPILLIVLLPFLYYKIKTLFYVS